jgi:hypothetical protein
MRDRHLTGGSHQPYVGGELLVQPSSGELRWAPSRSGPR